MRIKHSVRALLLATTVSLVAAGASAQTSTVDTSTMTERELYAYAEALRLGSGVDADPAASLALHQQLAEGGRTQSYVRMWMILVSLGRLEEAKVALESGTAAGDEIAARRLAVGNVFGRFGAASDPTAGFAQLQDIVRVSDNASARYALARSYENGLGTEASLVKAQEIYLTLADEGHGPSLRRLGNLAQEGAVGDPDAAAAIEYYRSAGENGQPNAWLELARVYFDESQYDEAIAAFENAIAGGVDSAAAEYATAHFLGEFGPRSDRALGAQMLETGAENGDVEMAAAALTLWERRSRRINSLDLEGVIAQMDAKMQAGDETATRALARAYRVLRWRIPQATTRHRDLVANYGDQLGNDYFVELFHSTYDTGRHSASRAATYDLVKPLVGEDFYDAARAVRATEMTAFVYLLQKELGELGYYSGRASGTFNNATLRATMRFCADQDIMDTCTHGPLTSTASSDIIASLAAIRG